MDIRPYRPPDCPEMAQLFYNTVHIINARDYTPRQLDAWATGTVDLSAWDRSFRAHRTLVAEEAGILVGFGDIDETGYLDRLYVHHAYQNQGIASALCRELEQGFSTVTTHASITAMPFFAGLPDSPSSGGGTARRAAGKLRDGALLHPGLQQRFQGIAAKAAHRFLRGHRCRIAGKEIQHLAAHPRFRCRFPVQRGAHAHAILFGHGFPLDPVGKKHGRVLRICQPTHDALSYRAQPLHIHAHRRCTQRRQHGTVGMADAEVNSGNIRKIGVPLLGQGKRRQLLPMVLFPHRPA